ncbi:protein kinase [Streptomyces sp. NPDC097941]|uniref:serine/threonine-protein kinase n=1 Tax=Streptomyces sp. NPDC097941 TaxID=3155685 RepID=UPI0033329178
MTNSNDGAGRVIAGRYRLLRRIGTGGMGRVWLAYDLRLACEVAVKEISLPENLPEADLTARVARARQEARLAARLRDHPHVATVHDVVEEDGLPWIVMAYVPGATDLQEHVRQHGPYDTVETARIGLAVLDALMAGHRLGVLHRDVKPANILLTRPGQHTSAHESSGQILLADYGIALRADSGEPRLTSVSKVVGTSGFLAPERARGAQPSPASDLFSLGATLYFAVTGKGPFDRDSEASTLTALLFEEPAPPEGAGELTAVLTGLLAKEPEQRMDGPEAARRLAEVAATPHRPDRIQKTHPPTTPVPTPVTTPTKTEAIIQRDASGHGPGHLPDPEPEPDSPFKRTRKTVIILVAAAVLLVGGGVWAGSALLGGSEKPVSKAITTIPTRPTSVRPYGQNVDLTRELQPGECVSTVWGQGKLKGEPNSVGVVDCLNERDSVDGQVIKTDAAASLGDAKKNGLGRCRSLLAGTVKAMPDVQPYALIPSKDGWDTGMHRTACLVFNKTVTLYGPVGDFRRVSEEIYLTNSGIGDCFSKKKTGDNSRLYLADCGTPHDEQVVGFVKAPAGLDQKEGRDEAYKLCANKYQSISKPAGTELQGWTNDSDWQGGFRYVMCTVYRPDGKKLTGDTTSPVSLMSPAAA